MVIFGTEDIRTHDLAYPATTDATKLVAAANALTKDRLTLVFSTYQSIQVLADAQQQGFGGFDLIICDETHRTTGLTRQDEDPSEFVKVHDNRILAGQKRLYMTATPRIYAEQSKTKASEEKAALFSMDDEATFGHEFYRLGFGKAVELDLLAEYKVLIVAVREGEMAKLANNFNNAYKLTDKKAIDIRFASKIVGSWKGLSKRGLVMVGEDTARRKPGPGMLHPCAAPWPSPNPSRIPNRLKRALPSCSSCINHHTRQTRRMAWQRSQSTMLTAP